MGDGYELFVETAPYFIVDYPNTIYECAYKSDISCPKKYMEGETINIDGKTASGSLTFATYINNDIKRNYCDYWIEENKYMAFINRQKKLVGYMKVHVINSWHIVLEKIVLQKYSGNVVIK